MFTCLSPFFFSFGSQRIETDYKCSTETKHYFNKQHCIVAFVSRSAFLYQKRWHLCPLLCDAVKMNQFYESASCKMDIVVWKTFQFMWRDTISDDVNSFSLLLSVSTNVRMKDFENDTANIILCWKPFNARSSVICMIIVGKKFQIKICYVIHVFLM